MTTSKSNDLKVRAFDFAVSIFKFIDTLPKTNTHWVIADQLLRSSSSIGANMNEAQGASSKKDFINFYHISLKSARETQYWLKLLFEIYCYTELNELISEIEQIIKMLSASLLTLKKGDSKI